MSKITAEHLTLGAFIYVRQSTAYQVANNLESQRRQYSLVERALGDHRIAHRNRQNSTTSSR